MVLATKKEPTREEIAAVTDRVYDLCNIWGIEKPVSVQEPYKLASRNLNKKNTVIKIGNIKVGDGSINVIAGPCAVENRDQLISIARAVKDAGATMLRGGAFKPRTSPYSFQGLGEEGLKILAQAREEVDLPIVTEVTDEESLPLVAKYADVLQIGTRNAQNFNLIKKVARIGKPILLKRGMSSTIEEWLMAAEYILLEGNEQVILCERGVRGFDSFTRNILDIAAVPIIKHLSHLPIIVDPSHAIGKWRYVIKTSLAAIVAGADGVIVEVHNKPKEALCDGAQSLLPEKLEVLIKNIKEIEGYIRNCG